MFLSEAALIRGQSHSLITIIYAMWDQYACFKFFFFLIFFQGCFTRLNFEGKVTILILILKLILHLILKYTLIIIVKQSLLLQILFHLKQKDISIPCLARN